MLQYYKCNSQRFLVNRQRNTYLLLGDNRLQYCLHFFTSISRIRTGNCFWDSVNTVPSDGNANPHLGLSRFKRYLYFFASLLQPNRAYHFTGSTLVNSMYHFSMYHFTEASFYWLIFVKFFACGAYHFTGVSFYWGKFVKFSQLGCIILLGYHFTG